MQAHNTTPAAAQQWTYCEDNRSLEELPLTRPCTFRVCDATGAERLLDGALFAPDAHANGRCSLDGTGRTRPTNAFLSQEQAAASQSSLMYPTSYAEAGEGFCTTVERLPGPNGAIGGADLVRRYTAQHVPTSGLFTNVAYAAARAGSNATHPTGADRARRCLVVYAAATLDDYQRRVTDFNLRRLRAILGQDTFIIVADATPSTAGALSAGLADALVYMDNAAPGAYDGAIFQEGMLEAYRLFGVHLLGFDALVLLNDSVLGPMLSGLADSLPEEPTLVAFAVLQQWFVCGCGGVLNRAAFTAPSFTALWRYMRFPCGKRGAIALWEAALHPIQVVQGGIRCYTHTNDLFAMNVGPAGWDSPTNTVPVFKHQDCCSRDAVLQYIETHDPSVPPVQRAPPVTSLQGCAV